MPDPVLGRAADLLAIERFLAQTDDGPALLTFEGDPGIGKTTILRAAIERAGEQGMRVLSGAGAVAETRLSYVGLTDLLDDVDPAYVAALPAPQREALDAALLRAHTPARSSSWEAVASGVRSLLETLSAEQPVVIAIDDLQWLDRSSARVLDFCIGRLNGRVGLIVTQRPGSEGVRIAQLSDRRDAVVRRLAPLDSAAIAALLREQGRSAPSRRVLTRIAETAGGNPLYALELLRALPEGELTTGPLALPPTLREMVATAPGRAWRGARGAAAGRGRAVQPHRAAAHPCARARACPPCSPRPRNRACSSSAACAFASPIRCWPRAPWLMRRRRGAVRCTAG